jgi:hypothetical protein
MAEGNFKMFKETWGEEIRKIASGALNNRGVRLIYTQFSLCRHYLEGTMFKHDLTSGFNLEMELLESRLTVALAIAHTRYILQNRSLWVKIVESISRGFYKGLKPEG